MTALILLSILATGCASVPPPVLTPAGLRSDENQYRLPNRESGHLIDAQWQAENFDRAAGTPSNALDEGRFRSEFEWLYPSGETGPVSTRTYELLLSHTTNATIWMRLLPVPSALRRKNIDVLLENHVNGLSGDIITEYLGSATHERRIATTIVATNKLQVLGHGAHSVTFDVVDLNQLEADPNAPRTRVEMVLVSIPFRVQLRRDHSDFVTRAYLLLGYRNDAHAFAQHQPAFHDLVQRLQVAPQQ